MKNILHIQIPIDSKGHPIIGASEAWSITKKLKKQLPKYYKVIATPFNIQTNKKTVIIDGSKVPDLIENDDLVSQITNMIENEGYVVKVIK